VLGGIIYVLRAGVPWWLVLALRAWWRQSGHLLAVPVLTMET
jgi:hypothetical protein